jgi:hypothetical protein
MKVEGYVCNNPKCNAWGTPKYFEYEGDIDKECKYCKEELTELKVREHTTPEVKAKDVMPNVITKGFTMKMKGS